MEESSMAGRFEGVSDLEWRLFEDVFPPAPPKRGRGMPHAPFRKVLNTLLYILITGCRWCDVPRGPQWASKSATHRWLRRWQTDGTLAATASPRATACPWRTAPRRPMETSGCRCSHYLMQSRAARAIAAVRANASRPS